MHLSAKDGLCDFRLKTGCSHVFKGERHFQGGKKSSTSVSAAATSLLFFSLLLLFSILRKISLSLPVS